MENENPVRRFRAYLEDQGLWSNEQEKEWIEESRRNILDAFNEAEKQLKPNWTEMFTDVYQFMPDHIT